MSNVYDKEIQWKEIKSKYLSFIKDSASKYNIDPAIICAIISRESCACLILNPPGPGGVGDQGHGRGICQIDDRSHAFFTSSNDWKDPAKNIDYGMNLLRNNIDYFLKKDPNKELALRRAIAGYNCGNGNVNKTIESNSDVDSRTANQDYSKNVLERAVFFRSKLEELNPPVQTKPVDNKTSPIQVNNLLELLKNFMASWGKKT